MAAPIYPSAIASWTDRIDQADTVWAKDPNSLAAEIVSMEKTLGTMPHVEGSVPVGNPVTYSSVSARISAVMLGSNMPYVSLYLNPFNLTYGGTPGQAVYNTYKPLQDQYGYFNGQDITIQATGRYLIDAYQGWEPHNQGWLSISLVYQNGIFSGGTTMLPGSVFLRGDTWNWDLSPVNKYNPEDSNGNTGLTWMGVLQKGVRVRVASQNGTTRNPYRVLNGSLKLQYLGADPNTNTTQPGNGGKPA